MQWNAENFVICPTAVLQWCRMNVFIPLFLRQRNTEIRKNDDVIKIGEIYVKLNVPDSHLSPSKRDIETSVYFGDTELYIRVVDMRGKVAKLPNNHGFSN